MRFDDDITNSEDEVPEPAPVAGEEDLDEEEVDEDEEDEDDDDFDDEDE